MNHAFPWKKVCAIVVLASFLGATAPIRADEGDWDLDFDFGGEVVLVGLVILLGEAYLVLGGATVAVGNGVYASRGEQSTSGWRNQGYALGTLNVIVGGVLLGFGIQDNNDGLMGFGAAQAGIGLADLGLTIWSSSQPDEPEQRVMLSPLVFPDAEGEAAVGVGVSVLGW